MCKGPEVGICLEFWENNREALTRAEEGGGCGGRQGESYAEGGHSRPVGRSQDTGFVFSVTRNQQRALSRQRTQSELRSNRIPPGCRVKKGLLAARVEAGRPARKPMQGGGLD